MPETRKITASCRCCHAEGSLKRFKSLSSICVDLEDIETYSSLLRDTFGITMKPSEASDYICDICMKFIKKAFQFKNKVLQCEKDFEKNCQNEHNGNIKREVDFTQIEEKAPSLKIEIDTDISSLGNSYIYTIPRMHIFDIWYQHRGKKLTFTKHTNLVIEEISNNLPFEDVNIETLSNRVSYVCKKIVDFWRKSSCIKERLLGRHSQWLTASETIVLEKIDKGPKRESLILNPSSTKKRGRHSELGQLGESSKRIKLTFNRK